MKSASTPTVFRQSTSLASPKQVSGFALTVLLLGSLALPTLAQQPAIARIAPEKGFTIAPSASTAIVLKTRPDAVCGLHAEGVSDPDQMLTFYANSDGYVKIHATGKQEGQESRIQLDCAAANGNVTRYPLHLVVSNTPTDELPAPESVMPAPKGSTMRPGLTEAEAQQLSNDELFSRGYPQRPDTTASPDAYAGWLAAVSRPSTQVPPHLISRSEIRHHTVQAGVTNSSNWSGYVADASKKRSYSSVHGEWSAPACGLREQ